MDSEEALRNAADLATVRSTQIMHVAMPMGAVLFAASIAMVRAGHEVPVPSPARLDDARVLALAMGVGSFMTMMMALVIPAMRLRPGSASDPEGAVALVRGTLILRLALLEGSALCGLTNVFLQVQSGVADAQPLHYLSGLPVLVLIAYAILALPSQDRFVAAARRALGG